MSQAVGRKVLLKSRGFPCLEDWKAEEGWGRKLEGEGTNQEHQQTWVLGGRVPSEPSSGSRTCWGFHKFHQQIPTSHQHPRWYTHVSVKKLRPREGT